MAFEKKYEIGFPGIIAGHHNRFFCIAITGFRVELQCNGSLTTGRDRPVKMGNGTTSAGKHLFDSQDGLADVFYIKFMD
jgi:hypothetical protein